MLSFLLTVLLIYLVVMALFVGVTMMTAYCLARDRFADPAFGTHLSESYPPGALKAAWRDFLATSRYYLLYPIGFFLRDPEENLQSDDELPPVLFIHGWTETRATWTSYLRRFRSNPRRKLYAFTLWPPDASLERHAEQLDRKAADVLSRTRHDRLLLVGHSMGGILARDYVRRHGADSVERIITIASPHQGTLWGYVSIGRSVAQMTTRCPYLAELAQDEAIAQVDVHCIASVHDNLVIPFDNGLMPGTHHHLMSGYGHVSITDAPETMELVARLLYDVPVSVADKAAEAPAPPAQQAENTEEKSAAAAPPVSGDDKAEEKPSEAKEGDEKKPEKTKSKEKKAEGKEESPAKRAAPKRSRKPSPKKADEAEKKPAPKRRRKTSAKKSDAADKADTKADSEKTDAGAAPLDPEHREALKRKLVKKLSEG